MFERFTDRARSVVMLAQEEARDLKHNYIGTEHLLLGLLREGEGLGGKALTSVGLDLETTRAEVERRIGKGLEDPHGHIPFTPRAKKVLELSLRQALSMSHNYIGTEHILLGLLREGEGVAAQILMAKVEHGLTAVHKAVIDALQEAGIETTEGVEIGKDVRTGRRWGRLGVRMPSSLRLAPDDEVVKRLEAIEARLSAIERILRGETQEETG